jgi:hypothetical protein
MVALRGSVRLRLASTTGRISPGQPQTQAEARPEYSNGQEAARRVIWPPSALQPLGPPSSTAFRHIPPPWRPSSTRRRPESLAGASRRPHGRLLGEPAFDRNPTDEPAVGSPRLDQATVEGASRPTPKQPAPGSPPGRTLARDFASSPTGPSSRRKIVRSVPGTTRAAAHEPTPEASTGRPRRRRNAFGRT